MSEEFYNTLTAGPEKFVNMVHDEISKMHCIENEIPKMHGIKAFVVMRNICPLMAYALVTEVKVIAKYDVCQSASNRVYNAYVSAIQSLDGLI